MPNNFHENNDGIVVQAQTVVARHNLKPFLDLITNKPTFIFSVDCRRRTDLELRYEPTDQFTNGPLAYKGDCIMDGAVVRRCDCGNIYPQEKRSCPQCKAKRVKIVLIPAGTLRTMVVKGKRDDKPTKHWESKGGELPFDPAEKNLYLVAGMYSDAEKDFGSGTRLGRHGQWRSWCFVDLETTTAIRYQGTEYIVV